MVDGGISRKSTDSWTSSNFRRASRDSCRVTSGSRFSVCSENFHRVVAFLCASVLAHVLGASATRVPGITTETS
jgi:hypothetical protein